MLDVTIGLACLLLAAVSLVAGRIWFSRQPGTSASADLGAMIAATLSTGLFAIGTAEMVVFVLNAGGMWIWIDAAIAAVGIVAIVAISFYVANHLRSSAPSPVVHA